MSKKTKVFPDRESALKHLRKLNDKMQKIKLRQTKPLLKLLEKAKARRAQSLNELQKVEREIYDLQTRIDTINNFSYPRP